jgi:hypothetical protein
MISGIVYFEEIVQSIKDATGIENTRPLWDKFRRFILFVEKDIGAGGFIIRKRKQFTKGDGYYDGKSITMPADFVGEYSYGSLKAGVVNGNRMTLFYDGPDEIDLYYMGFLLDDNGNPTTTRNHLLAVVDYAVMRLYSQKYFLGQGNQNQYLGYQRDYETAVLGARGNDVFPSESEWEDIGRTMSGGKYEALTNCGMRDVALGNNNPTYEDGYVPLPSPEDDLDCNLVDVFKTSLTDVPPDDVIEFYGTIIGQATVTGTLTNATP